MGPSEELSLTLLSELILKLDKLSVAINNDIPIGYYDTPLINTNTMASPLKHGDMSYHSMYRAILTSTSVLLTRGVSHGSVFGSVFDHMVNHATRN